MGTLELLQLNLLSPVVLAFLLGVLACLVKSDLKFPEALYSSLSIYLLLAIGLKGGVELSKIPLGQMWQPAVATIALGAVIPLWCFAILRWLGKFSIEDSAAIGAHYASCSVVTFVAGTTFLTAVGVPFEGLVTALVALMEVPGIIGALLIARLFTGTGGSLSSAIHETLVGRSVVLLLGGLAIGYFSGPEKFEPVAPFFVTPFQGILALFLLDMGINAAQRFSDLRRAGLFLGGFAIVMPVIHGLAGVYLGHASGLSLGGGTILGVLAASASYIAAPAAVRIALPEASPGYYLTASLAITFPFNLVVGIPLYYEFAKIIYG